MDDYVIHAFRRAGPCSRAPWLLALVLGSCAPSPPTPDAKALKITELERRGASVVTDDQGVVWSLHARGTTLSDADLAGIEVLSTLRHVDLAGTDVSDAGVAELAKLPSIEKLYLSRTHIGDGALVSIAQLANLAILDLAQTNVSDKGLAALSPLTHLEFVNLAGTSATPRGAERVKSLTHCRIELGLSSDATGSKAL